MVLWRSKKETDDDGTATTMYVPSTSYARKRNPPTGRITRFSRASWRVAHTKARFRFVDAGPVLRHRFTTAHSIRYYTVKDQAAAQNTVVDIASIGFFYVLTLFLGLGAMTSGAIDVSNDNMAAPLLARVLASCCSPSSRRLHSRPCWAP